MFNFKPVLACTLFSIFTIVLLYSISQKANAHKNGFTRTITKTGIKRKSEFNMKYGGYYLAGISSSHIYLANYYMAGDLVVLNLALTDTQHLHLHVPDKKYAAGYLRLFIDSPSIYLNEGVSPSLLFGNLVDLKMNPYLKDSCRFVASLPISSNSIVLKSIDEGIKQNILISETREYPYINKKYQVLQKQVDGLFCTDGLFVYDKQTYKLIYVYHYRNEYICMDTNLTILYTGRTIDTNKLAKINVRTISSEHKTTLSSPQVIVNKNACAFDNKLYVQSSLLADNEDRKLFDHVTCIDVYSLTGKNYLYSLYIPINGNKKIQDYKVFQNKLIVVDEDSIYVYEMNS